MEDNIIGHNKIREYLDRCITTASLSHAYFFVGPRHVGKSTVARWFIERLNVSECIIAHTDDNSDDTQGASVEEIRDALSRMNHSTFDGKPRIIFLTNVESMNAQAGNALLKALEEPPIGTLFILCASHESRVLPTLLSRSNVLRFSLVPTSEISKKLADGSHNNREEIITLCAGRPGRALRMMNDAEYYLRIKKEQEFFRECERHPLWYRMLHAQALAQSDFLESGELYLHTQVVQILRSENRDALSSERCAYMIEFAARFSALFNVSALQSSRNFADRLFIS